MICTCRLLNQPICHVSAPCSRPGHGSRATSDSSGIAMTSNGMIISATTTASTALRPRQRMRLRENASMLLTSTPPATTNAAMMVELSRNSGRLLRSKIAV